METKTATVKPAAAPKQAAAKPTALPRVSVRFDTDAQMWAVIDPANQGKPTRHFEMGILTDVEFSTVSTTIYVGCGSRKQNVGIATGVLVEGTYGKDMKSWHNLSFDGVSFKNEDGEPLRTACKVRLMPGRRALYKGGEEA